MVLFSRTFLALFVFAAVAPAQTTHNVDAFQLSFSPSFVSIQEGDSVVWTRVQGDHTVTEGTGPSPNGTEAFHQVLDGNFPTYTVTFDGRLLFEYPRPGSSYDYYCVPHLWANMTGVVKVNSQWRSYGDAHKGTFGDPFLWAEGPLAPGAVNLLQLENANPSSLCILFVGLSPSTPVPFKGGTLVAFPFLIQLSLFTSPTGMVPLPFAMPPGLSGAGLVFQYAIQDSGASNGVAFSNGAQGMVP